MTLDDDQWARWLFSSLPSAVFVEDLDGRLQFVNHHFEVWYACPESDWKGKTLDDLRPREQAEPCSALRRMVLETGETARAECEVRGADGSCRRVLSTKFPVYDASRQIIGVGTVEAPIDGGAPAEPPSCEPLPSVFDEASADARADETRRIRNDLRHVTGERDLAKAALLDNQRHLNLITRNLPVLIVHYDVELRYQFVNETYCRWRRIEPSDVLGRTIAEIAGPELHSGTRDAFDRVLAGEQVSLEYSDEFPDGQVRDIHGTLVPEKLGDDTVVGVFALGTDVSELKRMERALLRQTRLATLGQVTGTVARELRTPLSTILLSTAALGPLHQDAVPDLARTLERIERSVRRCSTIIADLLDFARTPTLSRKAVNLDGWLDSELSGWTLPPTVSLSCTLNAATTTLDVDRRLLAQAVENLRDNALEAMRPRSGEPARGRLTVASRVDGDRVEIVVADTGRGIPAHAREQVFEPLFTLGTVGVGLGLSMVQQIMLEHGGGAEVADSGPDGTTMVLWFPRPESTTHD